MHLFCCYLEMKLFEEPRCLLLGACGLRRDSQCLAVGAGCWDVNLIGLCLAAQHWLRLTMKTHFDVLRLFQEEVLAFVGVGLLDPHYFSPLFFVCILISVLHDTICYSESFIKNCLVFQNFCLINKHLLTSFLIFLIFLILFIVYFFNQNEVNNLLVLLVKYFRN